MTLINRKKVIRKYCKIPETCICKSGAGPAKIIMGLLFLILKHTDGTGVSWSVLFLFPQIVMGTGTPDAGVSLLLKTMKYEQKQISQLVHVLAVQGS